MSGDRPEVRLLSPADRAGARAVAVLHRRVFPNYDSSGLGVGFCTRLLRAYAGDPQAWVAVVGPAEQPLGYLVGAPPAVQRRVNRSLRPWAALASIGHPGGIVARLSQRVRRGGGSSASPALTSTHSAGTAEMGPMPTATVRVVLVGADPSVRGSGVGACLLDDFALRASVAGHEVADLSVELDNAAARTAYERAGWTWAGDEAGVAARYRLRLGGG